MNQVFIDSFVVENFGPFYGRKEFLFGPMEERCGILIGGKNGAGKTHLLRALYLAVVGETGVHDLKNLDTGNDATRFLFDKALNRRAAAEGNDTTRFEISLTQRPENGAGAKKLRLVRQVTFRPSGWAWHSEATKEDGSTEDDETVLQRLRDSFLPRHLARFFFFDAERSQGVHLGDRDIVEGISRILGLWSYGELQEDLRSLVQNKIPRAYSSNSLSGEETKLADLMAEVMRLNGHLKAKHLEKTEKQDQLRENESELASVEDELKALGAIDANVLESDRQRRDEIKTAKDQMEAELRTAWEMALPLGLLGPFRKELHDYLVQEEKRNEWDRSRATVEPKIPRIKSDVFEGAPREFALKEDYYAFYSARLEKALHGLFHPPPDGMSNSVFVLNRLDVSAQVRAQLASATAALKSIAELSKNIDRISAELRELDSRLKQHQLNSAAIARSGELQEKRRNLIKERDDISRRITDIDSEVLQLETQLTEQKREEENQRKVVEKAQKGRSLATLAARFREAAEDIQKRAAVQLRNKISEHVGELWVDITERGREFLGMEFDKLWNCWLVRRDGKKVSWEETNTSAGQRQVRMLAFYEALRRLARLVPP